MSIIDAECGIWPLREHEGTVGGGIKVIIDEARASQMANYICGMSLPLYLDSSIS